MGGSTGLEEQEDLTTNSISVTSLQHPVASHTSVILISTLWRGRVGGTLEEVGVGRHTDVAVFFSWGRSKASPQACHNGRDQAGHGM